MSIELERSGGPPSKAEPIRHAPAATSFFGSLRRVKALEGWYGLYKGMSPSSYKKQT